MNARVWAALAAILLTVVVLLGSPAISSVEAQGCSISNFTMSHSGQISLGTWVVLTGNSNCGTVRFTVNGEPRAETGQGNQTETFKSEEFGTGGFEICFVARGEGGWERADRRCQSIYVQGSQGAPPGSTNTGNVRCWVNNFSVTPSTIQQGNTANFSGYGQCDGNARAARFYINGEPYGEYGGNTTNATWNTSNASPGSYNICFGITSGEWSQEARSCVTLTVVGQSAPPPTPASVQGPQSDNNQPGQTDQSGPNNTYQPTPVPQQNPPPQQPNNPPPQQPQGNSGGNGGGSSGGSSNGSGGGTCPSSPATSQAGDIVTVSDVDSSPLNLRSSPEIRSDNIIARIPVRTQFTIIGSGYECNNGWRWYPSGYNGLQGWTGEVGPQQQYNYRGSLASSSNSGGSSGSSGNTGSGGSSGGSSNSGSSGSGSLTPPSTGGRAQTCPSVPARLVVGQQGRVIIDGRGATNVRRTPGGTLLTSMPEGTVFDVIDGPFCLRADSGNAIRWYGVRMANGTTGWSPEASNSTYALEPWSGGSSSGSSGGSSGTISGSGSTGGNSGNATQIERVLVLLGGDRNYHFTFEFDRSRGWIMNGSEYVVFQLQMLENRMSGLSPIEQQREFVMWAFPTALTSLGEADRNIRRIQEALCESGRTCRGELLYVVGDRLMDLSGVGNIAYGYFMSGFGYSMRIQDAAANWDQRIRELVSFRTPRPDDPDDIKQREVGLELSRNPLTVDALNEIANTLGLY